jgi:hypothetical protein
MNRLLSESFGENEDLFFSPLTSKFDDTKKVTQKISYFGGAVEAGTEG